MKQKKKQTYEKMPTQNGATYRYYLKSQQVDFINELAISSDKSPSEILRSIVDTYKQISFLVKKGDNK